MASDGTRVFVLGGYSRDARAHELSLIHVFDTSMYLRSVITSGQPSILRTQRTSSARKSSSKGICRYRLLYILSGATVLHS